MGLLNYTTRANLVAKTPENIADVTDCLDKIRTSVNSVAEEQLASSLAAKATPSLVTTLPVSPIDGQVVYYQSSALEAVGTIWTLRYRAGSGSSYKWEFVGGSPLANDVDASGTNPDGTPALTVPLAGIYRVEVCCRIQLTTTGGAVQTGAMWVEVNGGFDDALQLILANTAGTTSTVASLATRVNKTLAASDALVSQYNATGGAGVVNFSQRRLAITPVRVS